MAVSNGPNLVLMEDAADGDVHGNDMRKFMRWMDSLVQGSVISATVTAQPASPANGDTYIVPTGATGAAWASQVGRVARWTTRITTPAWEFLVPKEGWSFRARDTDVTYEHNGTAFVLAPTRVSRGHIDGLLLVWVSNTALTVRTGSAHVQSLNRAIEATADIAKAGLVLTANTWYHVYLFLNAGAPDVEIVTTAPAAPYSGTARSKTGDTSRRYIGSIKTDASGFIQNFAQVGNEIRYRVGIDSAPFRVLSAGMATVATAVSLSAVVPETSRMAYLRYIADSTAAIRLSSSDSAASYNYPGAPGSSSYIDIPVNVVQELTYFNASAPAAGVYLDVAGYTFER